MIRQAVRRFPDAGARMRGHLDTVLACGLIGLLIAAAATLAHKEPAALSGSVYAIDGDTLFRAGERLRLIGIDAPELDQTCMVGLTKTACGRRARDVLRDLVKDGVSCASSARDVYGRRLVTCSGQSGDIALRMVALGQAVASGCCRAEEAQARLAGRGLWAGRFDLPADWRRAHRRPPAS